jgi:predicted AlkP superfamily pyrophosphatase or phosphodiesterase
MKKITLFLLSILSLNTLLVFSQTKKENSSKPKLVVGIIVDQMRNDYVYRYWNRYSTGGFKRLVNEGFYFKNAHYNYIPTYTGPGHSSVYTGSTPRTHGIIANEWFVKKNFSRTNCVQDTSVRTVGSVSKEGMTSPKNLLSSTIGDELKMSSNQKGKVFAVALKDRSAILPAGHAANGAFWFDEESGGFISSTWYMKELPQWVKNFNAKKLPASYLEKGWNTLYPIASYTSSISDENRYEAAPGRTIATFPYTYQSYVERTTLGVIKATPFGNSITKDLAVDCIINEQLGKDDETDLFCISFSSTDHISHLTGPRSIEIEDVYLRLDKDIEELLNTLDREVGKNNYTVFLTADHGGADVPNHLLDNKIPAGYIKEKKLTKEIKEFFRANYGDTLLLANMSNEQVFINEPKLLEMKLNKKEVEERLANFLITIPGISEAYTSEVMKGGSFPARDYRTLLQNGYNHKLSGNVCMIYSPAWMEYGEKGTTHGAGYNYDTHVPVLFYGNGIKKGESQTYITVTQIAPTVCELLKINQPNSTISEPLSDFFK